MTYAELLRMTGEKKRKAVRELNAAINHPAFGFLCKAEVERKPGTVAWAYLAREFCETLAEHLDELMQSASGYEQDDILRIYMAYEDSDPDLYEMLPEEAQLFT